MIAKETLADAVLCKEEKAEIDLQKEFVLDGEKIELEIKLQ
jgi:hypothetical protein